MTWQRPLTGFERWLWMFDQASPLNVVMPVRLRGRLDPVRLTAALVAVCRHHPHLHARIDEGRPPRFVALPLDAPAPAFEVTPWSDDAWHRIVAAELNHDFDWRRGPLVRAHVLVGAETSDVILSFNHTVVDGHSAAVVADELLQLYAGGAEPEGPSPDSLDPPVHRLFGPRWRAWLTAMRMMREVGRMTPLPLDGQAPPRARRTHFIDACLTVEETGALVETCRAHGTTAHGAIIAAALLAAADEIREHAGTAITVGCGSPIDLRRHCGIDPHVVGNLVSGANSCHDVGPRTSLWDLAAAAHVSIRAAIDSGEAASLTRFQHMSAKLIGAARVEKMILSGERRGRAAVVVTNLGRVETPARYGDIELQRLSLTATANTVGGAMLIGVATAAGCMSLGFTFAEPLVAPARAERMASATMRRLRSAALSAPRARG